ncbi:MAG TPA: V-type ATP synthase subunit E [Nitrospira sp.]|nr:V-type ATP synthase subunit E [Nitrospira sp.]
MAYDTLIDTLLEEGRAMQEAILHQARTEAERLLNEAKQESEALDHEVDRIIHRDLAVRRTARLARAALSGRHIVLQTKQEILDAVWRHAGRKALALAGEVRAQVLRALLLEALSASSSPSPRVSIDGRERPYLDGTLKERGLAVTEYHQADLLLGVCVEANDEILTNCYATRLAKAKPELTIELNRLLFADPGQQSVISDQSSDKS